MNPKDRVASAKPNLSRLPLAPLMEVIAGMEEGATKYGPWNWRGEQVNETIYADAAVRHIMQYLSREDIDPDSGLHHISKAIAGLLILRDAQIHGCSIDDRGPSQELNLKEIGQKIAEVHARYAAPTQEQSQDIADHQDARVCNKTLGEVVPTNARAVSGRSPIGPDDMGKEVIFDRTTRGLITEWDEDDEILSVYAIVGLDEGNYNIGAYFTRDGEIETGLDDLEDSFEGYPERITHVIEPAKQYAPGGKTVAGGGSRLLCPSDDGRQALTRGGQQVTLNLADPDSRWPFGYTFLDEYDDELEDCCQPTGHSDVKTLSPQQYPNDIVELL